MFGRLFSKRKKPAPERAITGPFDLQAPLVMFSPHDAWTIGDACEGVQIFGGTGSGKTSGSGQAIAKAFLRTGFGGLVLTAKPDEADLWRRYCEETGRADSLIVVSPNDPKWTFNFLEYEMKRPGGGITENVVRLFSEVLEVAGQETGSAKDPFWSRSVDLMLRNAVDISRYVDGAVSVGVLHQIINSAPKSAADIKNESWRKNSLCYQLIDKAHKMDLAPAQKQDFELSARFWLTQYLEIPEKTRNTILLTFTGMTDGFLRSPMRELFCGATNFVPELTHEGSIIVLDLSIKEWGAVGRFSQIIFKLLWQRATERRRAADGTRPVFLWADESQFFITESDNEFQTTARSARACTVYLTQSLSNYYAMLGSGRTAEASTNAFLGNLQTKIFHAQGETVTNQWAADLIGQSYQSRTTSTFGQQGGSASRSESLEYTVLPTEFQQLAKGGPQNNFEVDALIFQAGRAWNASAAGYLRTRFHQKKN